MYLFKRLCLFTPFPTFPQRGRDERWPTRQSGAFAKIACKAIFKRSAPLGENERGLYNLHKSAILIAVGTVGILLMEERKINEKNISMALISIYKL
jgi:hypothetical protein